MKESAYAAVDTLIARYPALEPCSGEIRAAIEALALCYRAGGKLIVCGNGGSASDAEHIVGELMKGFLLPRHLGEHILSKLHEACDATDPRTVDYFMQNLQGALPAISLPSQLAISTAFSSDQAPTSPLPNRSWDSENLRMSSSASRPRATRRTSSMRFAWRRHSG